MRAITLTLITAGLAILYYGMASSGNPASYIHLASLVITMGGGLVSSMLSVTPKTIPSALQAMKKLLTPPERPPTETVRGLIELSQKARREGLLALESGFTDEKDAGIGTRTGRSGPMIPANAETQPGQRQNRFAQGLSPLLPWENGVRSDDGVT